MSVCSTVEVSVMKVYQTICGVVYIVIMSTLIAVWIVLCVKRDW